MSTLFVAVVLLAGSVGVLSDELEDSLARLKEAEASKDAALVKKLASHVCALARKEAAGPAPESPTDKDYWPKRVAYLRDVERYTEYALYATALQSPPEATVDLLAALEEQNPASPYLDQGYSRYFVALQQTGAAKKIPLVAEKALKHFPENEDLLLVAADAALSARQPDRALTYAERLIQVVARHPRPEGMPAADWERKCAAATGRARWIAGVAHSEKGQHYEADKDLRAALPSIKGDERMLATALFYLGVANYQLGASMRDKARILEAAKFSEQAAGLRGPLAQQAWRNAQAMRLEAQKLR